MFRVETGKRGAVKIIRASVILWAVICVAQTSSPSNQSLAGYWSFDEGAGSLAVDASPGRHNGLLRGAPLWSKGKRIGGLRLDGFQDYVETDSATIDTTGD